MTPQEMRFLVPRKLKEIEKEYGIHVLYAAESGSRAWGTHSESSDFDIRFIYIRPREDYLQLEKLRDVLEFPIDDGWDMCGWDLSKLLQLLHNSNSQIYEWFSAPVVYVDDGFSMRIRPMLDAYFSTRTMVNHYLHLADLKGKKRQKSEIPKVKYYLYSLQHIAAAKWVQAHRAPVPVSFQALMDELPEPIRKDAQELFLQKTTQPDQRLTPRRQGMEDWLRQEQDRIHSQISQSPHEAETAWEPLDQFFLAELSRTADK